MPEATFMSHMPRVLLTATFIVFATWFGATPLAFAEEPGEGGGTITNPQTITAAVPRNWPPYYMTDRDGNPAGYAVETMNAVAELANVEVRYVTYESFNTAMTALENKEVDVVPNSGIAKSRMQYALYSPPTENFRVFAFVRAGTLTRQTRNENGLSFLKGHSVAVIVNNIGQRRLARESGINAVAYENIHEAIHDLIAGDIDALVYPQAVVNHIVSAIGVADAIEQFAVPLVEVDRGVAVRDDAPELHQRLSAAVATFVQSDAYEEIYARWFGVKTNFWTTNNLIAFIAIPLIVLSVLLIVWRYASVTRLNKRLLDSQNSLAKLNVELESRVNERTRELAHEKARAEDYLNIAGTMILALDDTGTVTMINRKGAEVLGCAKGEIIGKNWFETFVAPEAQEGVKGDFRLIMSGDLEPVEKFENAVMVKGGGERLISWHNTYVRDGDGAIVGCLSAGEDITASRKTETALRVSERRFNQSQEFANIGTWDWNIQTGELYWSPRIAPLFGYAKGELETTYDNFLAAIHIDDRQAVIDAVNACVESGAEYNIEHRVVWPDGTVRWLHEKGDVVRDEAGNALNMLGVVQDITESKIMQEQLIQSSKMATLGEMATGVAHELNQPLNVIRMAVNNIQTKSKKGMAEADYLSDKLNKVVAQVERASAIIDHMRIFGRTTTSEAVALDPAKMVTASLGLIGEQLRLAGIEVITDLQDVQGCIRGHQVQVEQVLLNLLVNAQDAVKAADGDDKRITVRIGERDDGDKLYIEVEDTGGGIHSQHLSRIFEPFYTTKEVGKGTGLGLSISYGIITEMGGALEARNGEKGACFTITLPRDAREQAA